MSIPSTGYPLTNRIRTLWPAACGAGTTATIARNLAAFADDLGVSEEQACQQWADDVAGVEHVFRLIRGWRCPRNWARAIRLSAHAQLQWLGRTKPDFRVAKGLRQLGFQVPTGEHAVLVVAHAAAAEAAIGLLVLDQLRGGTKPNSSLPTFTMSFRPDRHTHLPRVVR